jgi:CheY-like chemotaxis protein
LEEPVKNVLIIDDSKDALSAFFTAYECEDYKDRQLILRDVHDGKNFEITISRTIEDGIKELSTRKWDLLLLDGRIPDEKRTGVEVMNYLLDNKQHLPREIRFCTGDISIQGEMEEILNKLF